MLDFIDTATLSNFAARHILKNSIAEATMPSGVSPYSSNMRLANEPWFTPMRSATPRRRHISMRRSNSPFEVRKLPGFMRTLSTTSAAIIAISGVKCMSATMAAVHPSLRSCSMIGPSASPSFLPCAVRRTISAPASAMRFVCSTESATSAVGVLVIDCTAMGCVEPILTPPNVTS